MTDSLERAPTPLIGRLVRCSAHEQFFCESTVHVLVMDSLLFFPFTGQHSSHSSTPVHPPSTPIQPQPPTSLQLQLSTPLSPYQVHVGTIPSQGIVPHDPQGETNLSQEFKTTSNCRCLLDRQMPSWYITMSGKFVKFGGAQD